MCVLGQPESVGSVLTFPSGYDTLEYSWVKATAVSVRADFIRDVAKYQQAFWRRCRGTVATLSTDSVVLVSSIFFFFDSTSTPATHGAAIPFTALFTQERVL